VLCGEGFGGSLAAYAALHTRTLAICFNSSPLGAGLQQKIGKDRLAEANQYLIQFESEKKPNLLLVISYIFDRIMSFAGIRTPGNFGQRYSFPTEKSSKKEDSDPFANNIIRYLGYNIKIDFKTIKETEELINKFVTIYQKSKSGFDSAIKEIVIQAIKSSAYPDQNIRFNHHSEVQSLPDEALFHLYAYTNSINRSFCKRDAEQIPGSQKSSSGPDHKQAAYACFIIEQEMLKRISDNPDQKKNAFLNYLKNSEVGELLPLPEIEHLRADMAKAAGDQTIFLKLAAKSHAVAMNGLKDAQIQQTEQDARPEAPKEKTRVLHAAMEYNRGVVGGLGSVTQALLPKQNEYNHDSRIITPFFNFYHQTLTERPKFVGFVTHEFKGKMVKTAIYKAHNGAVKGKKAVSHYLIQPCTPSSGLLEVGGPKELYNTFEHSNSADRFLYFSSAIAAFAGTYKGKKQKKSFDYVHLHGWHVGAVSFLLDTFYNPMREKIGLPPIKKAYHVHISSEHGVFPHTTLEAIGVPTTESTVNIHANTLKASDVVIYVSKAAAHDATTKEGGYGLEQIAQQKMQEGKLVGIINGIDQSQLNPTNQSVFGKYAYTNPASQNILEIKSELKKELYNAGLIADPTKPLWMFVGRYSSEKGIDMLPAMVEEIAKQGGQTLIMGIETPDLSVVKHMDRLKAMAANPKYNLKLHTDLKTQITPFGSTGVPTGKLIRYATDITIVPSHQEACGLVPMEAFSMGSLVISSLVQGMKDTCKGLGVLNPDTKERYNLENFNSFNYDEDAFDRRNGSIKAVQESARYLRETPVTERKAVVERLITSSKAFDWLYAGGAISQIERVY